MKIHKCIFLGLCLLIFSCAEKEVKNFSGEGAMLKELRKAIAKDSLNSIRENNGKYFSKELLGSNNRIIEKYLKLYYSDFTCGILFYEDSFLKSEFEGTSIIKGIRGNKKRDTVYVVPPFNYCEEGESYYFFDETLPRLYTESGCCHPENFFVIEDIDEDNIREIGIYYSACSGRYKSLNVYSLKKNTWKLIGRSTFDSLTQDPIDVKFESLVKKTAKNHFKMCHFIDGETRWESFEMKSS